MNINFTVSRCIFSYELGVNGKKKLMSVGCYQKTTATCWDVHWRSHCINLAVVFTCKNEVIRGFMTDLTSVCFFFANSPKRQQYFENFIDSHKELLKVSETNRTQIIGLSETRRVERHKVYENNFMIYKFVVSAFESIVNTKLYSDFYALLETEINDKWY